ncbi:hypothetical protein KAR91_07770 [Candidatus Pacearchaeota archaeon]|nr:hypothetical protein [Candidatus Pacearchaeota archaeon]
MTLLKATLKTELQKFLDDQYGGFTGYPTSAADHKTKFDAAIDTYLAPIIVIDPEDVDPNDTQIDVSNSGADFVSKLTLAVGPPSLLYDDEMADGFEEMIIKAVLIPSGDYFGGAVNPITQITALVAASKATVQSDIAAIAATQNTGEAFCEAVADSIHTNALLDYVTDCTYTNVPPPPIVGAPLAYG